MDDAVASSSRDRPARNRGSMHSLQQLEPHEGVVMTHAIHRSRRTPANKPSTIRIINQYEFKVKVGKGQHGEVYLAQDSTRGFVQVAVKSVRRKSKSDKMSKLRKSNVIPRTPHTPLVDQLGSTEHKIRKEIAIMKKLKHPHVVRLLEVIDDPLTDRIYMVMEYLGGGEIKWRSQHEDPLLRVDQTRRICRDVVLGLEYLHYQGIIHRDIKPANLLWTADRRTVKISDFGVSTFSYAQRLAAAGKGNIKDDDTESILMDESDLSKTAGTPMFLAPEIIADTSIAKDSSTRVQHPPQLYHLDIPPRRKPAITKAIDLWAFGVTLYGLLFGTLPFQAKTEYEIYHVIRNQDFDIPETMGLDQKSTAGRHPRSNRKPGERIVETEGTHLVDLLEKLLEKDCRKRITLEQVKRHPWMLWDLDKPEEWLRSTRLSNYLHLEATHDETSSAMSSVRFHWLPAIGNRIMSTLRSVRPRRSFRRPIHHDDHEKAVGVNSEPHIATALLSRRETTTGHPTYHQHNSVRAKGKRRSRQEILLLRNKSTNDIATKQSRAFEPWPMWASSATPGAGPSKSKSVETGLRIPLQTSAATSPLPSPVGSSQVTTPVSEYPGNSPDSERRRSIVQWVRRLGGSNRQSAYASYNSPLIQTSTSLAHGRSHHAPATAHPSRDSVDALTGLISSRQSSMSGHFTNAMRAASWTAPEFALARPSEDTTSINSGDKQLDDETLFYGAGGVAHSPVPSFPNSVLLNTMSSVQSMAPPAVSAAQAILSRSEGGADLSETNQQDPNAHPRHSASQARLRTTSPLAQVSYSGSGSENGSPVSYDSDDSSIYQPERRVREIIVNEEVDVAVDVGDIDRGSFDLQPSTSQMYQDEDEESEDDEEMHLEVRTRRASASASAGDMSPPRRSLSTHRPQERKQQRPVICT